MRLPRYPAYRHHETPWLGSLPAHWDGQALKRVVAKIESGVSVNAVDEPAIGGGIGVLKTSCVYTGRFDPAENKAVVADELDRVACPVKAQTLIVSRMNTPALVGAAGFVSADAENLFLPDRLWQVHFTGALPAFVHYWTTSPAYRAQVEMACAGTSSSMQNLSQDDFLRFALPLPSLPEQAAITSFLDHETAKIDGLIAEQEKLIALLAEKRQATISHAVTRGLNPQAPMKDSGVPWLGEVPAHWEPQALKHLCALLKDGTHLPPPRVENGVPLLSVRNIIGGKFSTRDDDSKISTADYEELCRAFVPKANDVVLAIVGATLGKVALIPDGLGPFHIQRSLALFRVRSGIEAAWLGHCLASSGFQRLLWENAGFSAQPGIYLGTLKEFKMPTPSQDEQRQICDFLGRELARLDALQTEAVRATDLLRERRSALIAAAVTGQIDVRGFTAA
jgi:type I restriction enzyme S subunit